MKKLALGLRAKILFGGLILLVPLAVSLFFVFQFGTSQIHVAQLEKKGLAVTGPILDALLEWQSLGVDQPPSPAVVKALETYAQAIPAQTDDLAYNAQAMKATGKEWSGPEALLTLAKAGSQGDYDKFAAVGQKLTTELAYLADSSGLVLDPDIDSYYLVLGLYQSLPGMLDGLTALRAFSRPGTTSLSAGSKLTLFANAKAILISATELSDQIDRSVKAVAGSYGPVPGYEEAMKAAMDPILKQATAIQDFSNQSALAAVFNPETMNTQLGQMIPLLKQFKDHGASALQVMLDHRIDSFTATLTTAFSVALAGLAIGLVVLLSVVASIRRRTALLVGSLGAVAQGDLTREVPAGLVTSGDELGQLARSVKVLQDDLRAQVGSLTKIAERLSHMGSSLAANTEESAAAIEQMAATSTQVARFSAGQLDQTKLAGGEIEDMLVRINESSELTQGMATQFFLFSQSMEANRRRIGATASEARVTGDLSENLTKTGEQGEHSLEALRQSIGGVVKKTQEIQEIVLFILDIADRTNLLSMNAAIEAAHAGSSGRGFAVVADEIRKLAETSSKQAQSIKTLVDGIAEAAAQTMGRSEGTSQSFKTVLRDITAVRTASQAIAGQMVLQEAEDGKLSEGLEEFTRFYSELSGSIGTQVDQSAIVQKAITRLGDSAQEISQSMDEQKLGMDQSTEAVIQVRDTTVLLSQVLEDLTVVMARFKT